MAGAARIAEFFASVGFQADERSLKSALTKVAAFGASVSVLAGGVFASLVGIAKAEADIAAQADKLGTSSERLEELRYVAEQTGSSADKLTTALESIASKNPRIKDTAAAFDLVSDRMRGMSELQRKLYAQRLGIDPTLIPMMTDDVAGLREEFRAMYAVAGTDAKAAAEESKGFLNELARLKTLSGMLAKAVGLAFIGKIRRDIENLRRVIMENFGKIQRILQIVIGFVMRVAGAIGAFVYRIIKWAGQLVGWFDSLDDGQKKLVIGVGLLIAAWKMLNLAFLTTPLGMLITGLAGIVALIDDYLTFMEGGESYFDWTPWADTIKTCVDWLQRAAGAIGTFMTEHQDLLMSVAKGIGVFMGIRGAIGMVIAGIGGMKKAFSVFTAALSANPFMLLLAVAVTVATLIIDNWDAVKAFFVDAWATIKETFGNAWDAISAKFPNLAAAAEAMLQGLLQQFGLLRDFVVAVFTGDFSGAVDAAIGLFTNFQETLWNIFSALGNAILGIFSSLWGKVAETFPDFGKWAESAGEAIKGAFGRAIGWVKDKLGGLVDMLPDWVLEKIGWKTEGDEKSGTPEKAVPASVNGVPEYRAAMEPAYRNPYMPPSGPAIVPTAAQRANMTTNNRSMKIDAKTEITVNGAQSPAETAKNVARQQTNVNADLVRHAQGAAR